MSNQPASLETIEQFLAQKRFALVGISRDPKSFSAYLLAELRRRGYDIALVNPNATEVQGQKCFSRVQDITPPVESALLMTQPAATEIAVQDCAAAGIKCVWMHRGAGIGSVSSKAVAFCKEKGIRVVAGQCPFMFLPETSGVHRLHGLIRKITGGYPRRAPSAT